MSKVGAGQRFFVGRYDISRHVTTADHPESTEIVEDTAIIHTKRHRVVQGLDDDEFSISAFWNEDTSHLFPGGEGPRVTQVFGLAAGAPVTSYGTAVTAGPKGSVPTDVGALVRTEYGGNANGEREDGYYMGLVGTTATGGTSADRIDGITIDFGTAPGNMRVRLAIHLEVLTNGGMDAASFSLLGSTDDSTYTELDSGLQIPLVTGGEPADLGDYASGAVGVSVPRYVSLQLATTGNAGDTLLVNAAVLFLEAQGA